MKGHTRIELKDVNTGLVEIKEDDNMVTNAINYYLASMGIFEATNLLSNASVRADQLWKNLLGGILLFDTKITESVNSVIPPINAAMIGNGAYGYANSGEVTELGSWNTTESGIQSDGSLKLVWDFATDQANGTIQSVCLTSAQAGFLGCGNATSKKRYASANINGFSVEHPLQSLPYSNTTVQHPTGKINSYMYMIYADYEENCIYYLDTDSVVYSEATKNKHFSTTKKIVINKYHLGLSCIDIRVNNKIDNLLIESYEITVPDEILEYIGSYSSATITPVVDENYNVFLIITSANGIVNVNANFYIIQLSDFNSVSNIYKLTNTSLTPLYLTYTKNQLTSIRNGYLYNKGNGNFNYLVKINISNSTDVARIYHVDENLTSDIGFIGILNDSIYTPLGGNSILNGNYLIPCNGIMNNSLTMWKSQKVKGNPLLYIESNNTSTFNCYRNCLYLATINNLQEAVTKTASKTMKVTYTITF